MYYVLYSPMILFHPLQHLLGWIVYPFSKCRKLSLERLNDVWKVHKPSEHWSSGQRPTVLFSHQWLFGLAFVFFLFSTDCLKVDSFKRRPNRLTEMWRAIGTSSFFFLIVKLRNCKTRRFSPQSVVERRLKPSLIKQLYSNKN